MPLKSHRKPSPRHIQKNSPQDLIIALAGNPNVGKSTLFNRLTGLRQHTGNWTGKTVELAVGEVRVDGRRILLVDLPGTYSLHPASGEECVARDFLLSGKADAVIAVCDSTHLSRTLTLGLQIADLGIPCLACLNLCDSAQSRGIQIDAHALSDAISLPVVQTSGKSKQGLDELLLRTVALADAQSATTSLPCGHNCHSCDCYDCKENSAYSRTLQACAATVHNSAGAYGKRDRLLDHIFLGKYTAVPVLLSLVFLLLWLSAWGAGYPSAILEELFLAFGSFLAQVLGTSPLPLWMQSLLLEGIYATISRVVAVMLPPMAIFFPLFSLLEDLGYLPRAAACLDRPFAVCGSGGKQALCMCMGLGCNAVGVSGCRIIESPRQRVLAVLTCSFMPCNGKFAAILTVCALFLGTQSGIGGVICLLLLTILCVGMTLIVTRLLSLGKKTTRMNSAKPHSAKPHSAEPPFALELPAFRLPHPGQILTRSLFDRILPMLGRAVLVAAPAGALIWLAGRMEIAELTLLDHAQAFLQPFGALMGLDGAILLAFLLAFPANELLLPSLLAIYGGTSPLADTLLANHWTVQTALCMLFFLLFHLPCATTLLTVWKETRSAGQTLLAALLPLGIGIMGCGLIHALFGLLS